MNKRGTRTDENFGRRTPKPLLKFAFDWAPLCVLLACRTSAFLSPTHDFMASSRWDDMSDDSRITRHLEHVLASLGISSLQVMSLYGYSIVDHCYGLKFIAVCALSQRLVCNGEPSWPCDQDMLGRDSLH